MKKATFYTGDPKAIDDKVNEITAQYQLDEIIFAARKIASWSDLTYTEDTKLVISAITTVKQLYPFYDIVTGHIPVMSAAPERKYINPKVILYSKNLKSKDLPETTTSFNIRFDIVEL